MRRSARLARVVIVAAAVSVAFSATFPAETVALSTLLQAGDAALAKFDLDAALVVFRRAYEADPHNYEATWKLARAVADKGTLTEDREAQKKLIVEAEQLARTAVALNAKDPKRHVYLAVAVGKLALFEGGKRKVELSKEVKTEAEKAIELNPQEDVAYHVRGIWYREMVKLNWVLKKFAEL